MFWIFLKKSMEEAYFEGAMILYFFKENNFNSNISKEFPKLSRQADRK
jgi:hypothetical protein